MKKYICLNHGECNWADEIPPREFSLDEVDANCPNCGSTNIREAVPEQNKLKRLAPFFAGIVFLFGLTWFFWTTGTTTAEKSSELPDKEAITSIKDSTSTTVDTINVATNDSTTIEGSDSVVPPVVHKKSSIIWTMVEGSGFCDPALDGTFLYTERNNLGQERERKVMNKAGCYPANN